MKKDIHPKEYRPVIFVDTSSDAKFLISSTIETDKKAKWEDGKEYPVVEVEISSASHPFYTGQEKVLDTAGRVERFKARQAQVKGGKKSKQTKRAAKKAKKDK